MHLPDLPIGIGAGCVEIAQRPMPNSMRGFGFFQHSLNDEFGMTAGAVQHNPQVCGCQPRASCAFLKKVPTAYKAS